MGLPSRLCNVQASSLKEMYSFSICFRVALNRSRGERLVCSNSVSSATFNNAPVFARFDPARGFFMTDDCNLMPFPESLHGQAGRASSEDERIAFSCCWACAQRYLKPNSRPQRSKIVTFISHKCLGLPLRLRLCPSQCGRAWSQVVSHASSVSRTRHCTRLKNFMSFPKTCCCPWIERSYVKKQMQKHLAVIFFFLFFCKPCAHISAWVTTFRQNQCRFLVWYEPWLQLSAKLFSWEAHRWN